MLGFRCSLTAAEKRPAYAALRRGEKAGKRKAERRLRRRSSMVIASNQSHVLDATPMGLMMFVWTMTQGSDFARLHGTKSQPLGYGTESRWDSGEREGVDTRS